MDFITKAYAYFEIVSQVVAVSAMIAALTPTTTDDAIIGKVRKVIDIIGFNFGYARNKE